MEAEVEKLEEQPMSDKLHNEMQRKASLEIELCSLRSEVAQLNISLRAVITVYNNTLANYMALEDKTKSKWFLAKRFFKLIAGRKVDE
jgi:hypothetical protein